MAKEIFGRSPGEPESKEGSENGSNAERRSVVVLSCGAIGFEVSNRLVALDSVRSVVLVTTAYQAAKRRFLDKVRRAWQMEGLPGLTTSIARRFLSMMRRSSTGNSSPDLPELDPRVRHLSFRDFHDPACISALRAAEPDIGVLAGTYILRESVFGIPRLVTINLHSGKVPEYRGAAPAFWEMYYGEKEVGITIHEVVREVDAGSVFRQELFPLDPAPAGDPLEYVERYRGEVLVPNGIRMLVETVEEIATGRAEPQAQEPSLARTFRSPDYRAKCEVRRRVARRRKEAGQNG